MVVVAQITWPFGFLYLSHYSFLRCKSVCEQFGASNASTSKLKVTLTGHNKTFEDLVRECDKGFKPRDNAVADMPEYRRWTDPHYPIFPQGAWVLGYRYTGEAAYDTDRSYVFKAYQDCGRFSQNVVVILITVLLMSLVALVFFIHSTSYALIVSLTVAISALICTGILKVWLGWVACRRTSLSTESAVFSHLLHGCLATAGHGATKMGVFFQGQGQMFFAYESKFRHAHQISRSEVHIGGMVDAVLLVMIIAAHLTFRRKRMQATEARYELICRRPHLVKCFMTHNIMDQMQSRDRAVLLDVLDRLYQNHHENLDTNLPHLTAKFKKVRTEAEKGRPKLDENTGTATSFWLSSSYALLRALLPCIYRQFFPTRGIVAAVPEENTLWMLSSMLSVVTHFIVYTFILFQIWEASRRYTRTMQTWLLFDSHWTFPSMGALAHDAQMQMMAVHTYDDGEQREEICKSPNSPEHDQHFSFTTEHVSSVDCMSDNIVNMSAVRDFLPNWWAWREYLIIDYTDTRVRLELHLIVAFAILLMSSGLIYFDAVKNDVQNIAVNRTMDQTLELLETTVTALTFQALGDLLFLMPPVLHAIFCAANINRLIEVQLQRVDHLADCVGPPIVNGFEAGSPGDAPTSAQDEVGPRVRHIFRLAKAEQKSGGASATRLLSILPINQKTLAVASTLLSLFTGGQVAEILKSIAGSS
uniref:Uncharacterized protein n=1 Tax=Alexandrium monilatum TaxID=311494 RepID=A0A7S4VVB1_9DINO